jgi:hypothetical protein
MCVARIAMVSPWSGAEEFSPWREPWDSDRNSFIEPRRGERNRSQDAIY